MCGQLTLIKYVSSLPIYFISFFKALMCIVSLIEFLLNIFILGGGGVKKLAKFIGLIETRCVRLRSQGVGIGGLGSFI